MIQASFPMRRVHILVRLDANHLIGLAHAIRVSAILKLLTVPHYITVAGNGEQMTEFFPGQRMFPVPVEDSEAFFLLIDEIRPDVILVDHPRPGANFWHELNARAGDVPIVAIDDEGGDVKADLIINGTVLDQYHKYLQAGPQAQLMVGGQYALIRPVFGATPWQNPREDSVVVVVGSGDRACEWALQLMSGSINLTQWGKVRMVVGRAFPNIAKLQHDCDALGVSLGSGLSGEKMAEAFSQATVALITGGMVVYEALAIGVPAIVFPQIENLIPEARWFAQRGCIVDLGYEGGTNSRLVSHAVKRLLESTPDRHTMSSSQRATIDGCGMLRAAKAISDLIALDTNSIALCVDTARPVST